MEIELKEMEERYSEISVKFAEVEGERQKLVMTIRNLKNAKKNQTLIFPFPFVEDIRVKTDCEGPFQHI